MAIVKLRLIFVLLLAAVFYPHTGAYGRQTSICRLLSFGTRSSNRRPPSIFNRRPITADRVATILNLQEHFEGGQFRETWRANFTVDLGGSTRTSSTSIYYVMARGMTLAWHKLQADNIHVWHSGGVLRIHILEPNVNGEYRIEYLGNTLQNRNWKFQFVVPSEHWYAIEVLGSSSYTLWGEIVSPGWEFEDFTQATKEDLLSLYPNRESLVDKFLLKEQ